MKDHAEQVLSISKNAPAPERGRGIELSSIQNDLNATVTIIAVIAKLTQGPQIIVPAMSMIAEIRKNDLAKISPICDTNLCDRRRICELFSSYPKFPPLCGCGRSFPKRKHRSRLFLLDVENGVQPGNLQQVVHLIREFEQLQLSTLLPHACE